MASISNDQRRQRLGQRHFLAAPASSVEQVAGGLAGLHSSDPVTVYLSCRARVRGFAREDLDAALYAHRSLLRLHAMRRTMFVVPPDLATVMTTACTSSYIEPERRRLAGYLESSGVAADGDAWLRSVESDTVDALRESGEATARELREIVPELKLKIPFGSGKKWGGQVGVSTRVLFLLATAGRIVRTRPLGTWVSSQYRWELFDRWYPSGLPPLDQDKARAELTAHWLGAYGPGTLEDIKWWTGWGIGVTRKAIDDCGAIPVDLETGPGFLLPEDDTDSVQEADWVALLPSLDPTVMGWRNREWYLGEHSSDLFDRNGNAGPTVWVNGRVVGGWAQAEDGEIRIKFLEAVGPAPSARVEDEAHQLEAWVEGTRITPRFRTPLEKRLLA